MAKLKTLALTISGLSAVSGTAYAQNANPSQTGLAMMRLNSSLLDQAKAQTFGSGSLWASLRKDFKINEVNSELIRRHENRFAANRAYFDRTINRSRPYMYHIANEVKKRNMPAEIALLPFIESAFVTKAKSHVGASGLWQFMPATGRHYGLEKTPLYDGRHDVYAATNAALNYLQYLHGLFGDWSLALAAYNWGEGNVGRAVNRARAQGLEPTYENLRMPNETRNYVPKLLAVRNIVANPNTFGMNISEISNQPYFQSVEISKPIDNSTIARLANISETELLTLNPAFNAPVFIPKNNRKLLLPVSAVSAFEKNYRNANPETLLSWDSYNTTNTTSLNAIASETGMTVAEIKRLNNIESQSISEGKSILVAKNTNSAPINFIDISNTPQTYQPNMPETAPVQVVKAASDPIEIKEMKPSFATPIDFIAQSKKSAEQQQTASLANASLASNEPTSSTHSDTASANTESLTPSTNAATASLASNLIETSPDQTAATAIEPTETAVVEVAKADTVSVEENDELMQLVKNSDTQNLKAEQAQIEIAQNTVVDSTKARTARLTDNLNKQKKRMETRLAKVNNQQQPKVASTVASGMHRVSDGDTLFNISRRYDLSVADLVIANNIKGNNIKKGQLLRISSAPAKTRNNIQNVSYTVRKGDTLNTIATRFNVDINDIRKWNKNTRSITPGQRLKLTGS